MIDYRAVDPALGTWDGRASASGEDFGLMFDLVLNHVLAAERLVPGLTCAGIAPARDYFIEVGPGSRPLGGGAAAQPRRC